MWGKGLKPSAKSGVGPDGKKVRLTSFTDAMFERRSMLCENVNFAGAEAYKLLRANIMFSFTDSGACRVIGVTSALRGEGKSLTSINTAFSLAQLSKRVLLVEADLRLPSVAKKLSLSTRPGLSNLLVGLGETADTIQTYRSASGDVCFDIITAGDIPPNPSELLGSDRMLALIAQLEGSYDYILLDLPPVISVSDALVVSRFTHGMLVVVRQDYCQRATLNEVIKQLAFANAKVLGLVFNGATEAPGGYSSRYRKFYRKNGGKYYGKYYSQPAAGKETQTGTGT